MEGAGFNNHGLVEIHVLEYIGSDVRSKKSRSSEYDLMPPAPSFSCHIEVSWKDPLSMESFPALRVVM